jgi:two-component sensor histidine kinase
MLRLEASARLNGELFRELQHRVANNFQIVSATLQKAQREISDPAAGNAVASAIERTNSLAQLHRRLYDPGYYERGLAHILGEVLDETFRDVMVDIRVDVPRDPLPVHQMTSIVLLVNEAAINSAKHVFRLNLGRTFSVALRKEDEKRALTIEDDGPGFGIVKTAGEKSRYGLLVMRGLAAQLGGALEIEEGPGAAIRVTF